MSWCRCRDDWLVAFLVYYLHVIHIVALICAQLVVEVVQMGHVLAALL
jgi:hypothetical protein